MTNGEKPSNIIPFPKRPNGEQKPELSTELVTDSPAQADEKSFEEQLADTISGLIENVAESYAHQDSYEPEESIKHAVSLTDSKAVLQALKQKVEGRNFTALADSYIDQLIKKSMTNRARDEAGGKILWHPEKDTAVQIARIITFETLNAFFFGNPSVDPHDPHGSQDAYKDRYNVPLNWQPGEKAVDDVIQYRTPVLEEIKSWGDVFGLIRKCIDERIAELS